MKVTENEGVFLSKEVIRELSEAEKRSYYNELSEKRKTASSTDEMEKLAYAYSEMEGYLQSNRFAKELADSAESKRTEETLLLRQKRKKIIISAIAAVVCFAIIITVIAVASSSNGKKKSYAKAVELYNNGSYSEALEIFEKLGDYENTALYIISIGGILSEGTILGQSARVGSTVKYGSFSTDGNNSQAIEWLVLELDQTNGRAMLISANILSVSSYGDTAKWTESDIRAWLNNEFLSEAFSAPEASLIVNYLYEEYDEESDIVISASMDKISLLSTSECKEYLVEALDRKAVGANTNEWWLRSVTDDGKAVYVTENGLIATAGTDTSSEKGVRPVMWVYLDK